MWKQYRPRSERAYARDGSAAQSSVRAGKSPASDLADQGSTVGAQEQHLAHPGTFSGDRIQRGWNRSLSLLRSSDEIPVEESQMPKNRGKLVATPCWEFPPAKVASTSRVESGPPDLPRVKTAAGIPYIQEHEQKLLNLLYARTNQPIPTKELLTTLDCNIGNLKKKVSNINKALVYHRHRPILNIPATSKSDNLTPAYVWEGPDAPIRKKLFGIELREHSLSREDSNGNCEVTSLRVEDYRILAVLFLRGNLGLSVNEILSILAQVGIDNHAYKAIEQVERRINRFGLTIAPEGPPYHPDGYVLQQITVNPST